VDGCDETCCFDEIFGEGDARSELRQLRRSGPRSTSRQLIDGLAGGDPTGLTVLDIGAGVGAVHLELLGRGAASAVDIDASSAYIAASREEAARRGLLDLVRYEKADFVTVAGDLEPADLVALDRVVCCYRDMPGLLDRAARLTRRRLGLVLPRDTWLMRSFETLGAGWFRLRRKAYRPYVHRIAAVDAVVASAGLRPLSRRQGLLWLMIVYERPA
jgi:magnesium-protoporphyrin O-methyltransferase